MPSAEGLLEVIRVICDYMGQKDADTLPDERVLELLGALKDDQTRTQVNTGAKRLTQVPS